METPSAAEQEKTGFPTGFQQLLAQIAYSPFTIAPEKMGALSKIREKHNSDIHLKDENQVDFRFEVLFGQIFTTTRSLQHIWTAACLYASLYCERQKANARGEREITILENENIEPIMAYYSASRKAFKAKKPFAFPANTTWLMKHPEYLALGNELFRLMCAFSILHEIGHAEREHGKLSQASVGDGERELDAAKRSQAGELEADKWAYDWILSAWKEHDSNPKVFIKRTLGIIFAMVISDEFRNVSDDTSYSDHPPGVDRLLQFFGDYEGEIEDNEWKSTCFSAISLGLQVVSMNSGKPLPTSAPYNGIRDFLEKTKAQHSPPPIDEITLPPNCPHVGGVD